MKTKFYRDWLYYLFVAAIFLFRLLPTQWGIAIAGFLGRLVYFVLPKERGRMLDQLEKILGNEKSDDEISQIAKNVFSHYGKMLAELVYIDRIMKNKERFFIIEGLEHLRTARAKGKGAICLASHLGNWEFLGAAIRSQGFPLTAVAKKVYFDKFDQLLIQFRKKLGTTTIYQEESARAVSKALANNEIVVIVSDQDIGLVDSVFVNFFDHPAHTPTSPVRFSKITGAPIIPSFIIREGKKHHVHFCPSIEMVQREDREEEIRINTQTWVSIQEKWIRQYPDQWVWNHRRWKTQPANPTAQPTASSPN